MTGSFKFQHHVIGVTAIFLTLLWLLSAGNNPTSAGFKIKEVSTNEAKALVDAGAVIIDVRGREAYESRHIPGAIHIPLEELRTAIPGRLDAAKDQDILVYCNEGTARGPESTAVLNNAGFSRAVNLKAGIEGWAGAGYPVGKGG